MLSYSLLMTVVFMFFIIQRDFSKSVNTVILRGVTDPLNRDTKYYRVPELFKFGPAAGETYLFSLGVIMIESLTSEYST